MDGEPKLINTARQSTPKKYKIAISGNSLLQEMDDTIKENERLMRERLKEKELRMKSKSMQ